MVLRATGRLTGAVKAEKGDDVSHLPAKTLNKLMARGLVIDDGKDNPPVVTPEPRKRTRKE